jgi:hypothetical protein
MNRAQVDTNPAELESLLAIERELVPESDELRHRVMQRARASLPRTLHRPFVAESLTPRGVRLSVAAAAVVPLSALCFAAFYAGYQIRNRSASSAVVHEPVSSIDPPALPAPSVVVALVPVDMSVGSPTNSSDNAVHDTGVVTVRPAVSARTATEIEAYALELQVLQPARRAVAQRDFGRALGAITDHQRRFPAGKLTEEREALRVKALLGLGRTAEAERAGTAFRARFPHSALLGRIDDMLGTQK